MFVFSISIHLAFNSLITSFLVAVKKARQTHCCLVAVKCFILLQRSNEATHKLRDISAWQTRDRRDIVTGAAPWLVKTDHVTWILGSYWSIQITWPEYWLLIGLSVTSSLVMAAYRHRRDSVLEQVSDINSLHKLLLCAKWVTTKFERRRENVFYALWP